MSPNNLQDLTTRFRPSGRVEAIYIRPARSVPVTAVSVVRAEPGRGLIGDRRSLTVRSGDAARKREVTLFQAEHLPTISALLGETLLDASRLRRNLVVSGINLVSMKSPWKDIRLEWSIGDEVVLLITGSCDPCSRMEEELGYGGYNAMRGHGGVTAQLMVGGTIRVGDPVRLRAG
jgi:MOSC domain-containing protein YiiM